MAIEKMQEILLEYGIATWEEIGLVTAINGNNEKAYLDILYAKTGYRNFDQFLDEQGKCPINFRLIQSKTPY